MHVERDIAYTPNLRLDIYHAQNAPVVVYVHGGGWTHGDKATDGARRLAPLAEYGVTVVSVDYTLAPAAVFPQQLDELRAAVAWVRANLPGTEKLGIWGASAGAYLGSLLALSTEDVQAVVHWFGQADLVASAARSDLEARLLPFHFEADLLGTSAEQAQDWSLLPRISPKAPPFLIAHGDRDRIVPPTQAYALHHALGQAGVRSRLELVAGAGHEDAQFDAPEMLATTAAWLRTVLRPGR